MEDKSRALEDLNQQKYDAKANNNNNLFAMKYNNFIGFTKVIV